MKSGDGLWKAWRAPVALQLASCAVFALGLQLHDALKWWVIAAAGLLSLWAVRRATHARLPVMWVLLLAIPPRVATWITPPLSSGDLPRYAWEARVVVAGFSPYAFAPDAPELARVREQWPELWARVEHRSVPAAYPPLAQATFVAAYGLEWFGLSIGSALRAVAACGDLAVLIALASCLRARGFNSSRLAMWAWSPLVALEFVGAGHFDAFGIALWLFALSLSERGRGTAAWVLGCAASVKFLPLAAAPFFGRGAQRAKSLLIACAALIGSYALVATLEGGATGWFRGISVYATSWESTDAIFRFVDSALRLLPFEGVFDPRFVARGAVGAAWLATMFVVARSRCDAITASLVAVGAFLLLSPTLHPWYVTWIVPFVVFRRTRGFEWLLAVAPLCYVVLERSRTGLAWTEPPWLWPVVFGPCLILLAVDARRREVVA